MSTVAAKSATGAIGAGQKNMMGGDVCPIPMATCVKPTEQQVIVIAKFAVAGTCLVFINVESGFWWSCKGVNYYMLAIKTQDDKGTYCDAALVSDTVVGGVHTHALFWYNHKNN